MSTKTVATKKCFHDACASAVDAKLGPGWTKVELGPESWTVRFQRITEISTRVLQLRLAEKRQVVEIVLAVKRASNDPMPKVWWEDRALHPKQSGYAKVLWSGPAFSSEVSIAVPRESWSVEFGRAIEKGLASMRSVADHWYTEAESELTRLTE